MKMYKIDGFRRIAKIKARKRYDNGETIYLCPIKLRPGYPWHPEVAITKTDDRSDDMAQYFVSSTSEFDNVVNSFEYYNCNYSVGIYPAFYVKEES